jgi:hypothetical protein
MTPRKPQCEVFWSFKSSPEFSGVPEDSNLLFFQVLGFTPTLGQSRVATAKVSKPENRKENIFLAARPSHARETTKTLFHLVVIHQP